VPISGSFGAICIFCKPVTDGVNFVWDSDVMRVDDASSSSDGVDSDGTADLVTFVCVESVCAAGVIALVVCSFISAKQNRTKC